MRICFFTHNVCTVGGVQRVVSVLANELAKYHEIEIVNGDISFQENRDLYNLNKNIKLDINNNVESDFILKKIGRYIMRYFNNRYDIFNQNKYNKVLQNIYYPKHMQKAWIDYFNSKKYDIIIGVEGYFSILLGIIADKLVSKTIGWQHSSYDRYLNQNDRKYWNIILINSIKNLDEYVVLNEYDQEQYKLNKNIDCKMIYNPKSFISEEKSNLKSKQFLAAGRMEYVKGFDLLIDSFKLFNRENKDWKLIIVGDGSEKSKLVKQVKQYNLEDRVIFRDFTNNIKNYFIESSILLLPSRQEGMPMLALESIELGVPIISYNISAMNPIVTDGVEGRLIECYKTDKFSECMLELANSYALRVKMGEKAIKKSSTFDLDKIVDIWLDLFRHILD